MHSPPNLKNILKQWKFKNITIRLKYGMRHNSGMDIPNMEDFFENTKKIGGAPQRGWGNGS